MYPQLYNTRNAVWLDVLYVLSVCVFMCVLYIIDHIFVDTDKPVQDGREDGGGGGCQALSDQFVQMKGSLVQIGTTLHFCYNLFR